MVAAYSNHSTLPNLSLTYIYTYIHIYIYTYTYIHIHIYIYIYTCSDGSNGLPFNPNTGKQRRECNTFIYLTNIHQHLFQGTGALNLPSFRNDFYQPLAPSLGQSQAATCICMCYIIYINIHAYDDTTINSKTPMVISKQHKSCSLKTKEMVSSCLVSSSIRVPTKGTFQCFNMKAVRSGFASLMRLHPGDPRGPGVKTAVGHHFSSEPTTTNHANTM